MTDIEQRPAYAEGFYAAQDGEPIWIAECSLEYKAGWTAYWEVRKLLQQTANEEYP